MTVNGRGEMLGVQIVLKQLLEKCLLRKSNPRAAAVEMHEDALRTLQSVHSPLDGQGYDGAAFDGARKFLRTIFHSLRLRDHPKPDSRPTLTD
jgi:hypothetical protein